MPNGPVDRVRRIATALPGWVERVAEKGPEFTVDDRPVCSVHDERSSGGRLSLWCASPPGVPEEMVDGEPQRFFHPVSESGVIVGHLGVYLDGTGDDAVDWDEIAAILDDAHVTVTGGAHAADDEVGPSGRFRFTARLWLHTGEAAWCFATVPPVVSAAVDQLHGAERRGFGSRRVSVVLGATTWSTSIFPDASAGTYVLPIKKAVRKAEAVGEGDDVDITIQLVDLPDLAP